MALICSLYVRIWRLLHTAEYRYFVGIEATPHTRSLNNFSEFTCIVRVVVQCGGQAVFPRNHVPRLWPAHVTLRALWATQNKVDTLRLGWLGHLLVRLDARLGTMVTPGIRPYARCEPSLILMPTTHIARVLTHRCVVNKLATVGLTHTLVAYAFFSWCHSYDSRRTTSRATTRSDPKVSVSIK